MLYRIAVAVLLISSSLSASLQVLPSKYLVSYGKDDAPYQVVEFVSLTCPFCVDSYNSEFGKIKKELIDTGLVQWVFHPMPLEEATSRAFSSLQVMDSDQRRIFLELIMETAATSSYKETLEVVSAFSEKKGKVMNESDEIEFFTFLSNSEIDSSPVMAINGVVRRDLRPILDDIKKEVIRHGI